MRRGSPLIHVDKSQCSLLAAKDLCLNLPSLQQKMQKARFSRFQKSVVATSWSIFLARTSMLHSQVADSLHMTGLMFIVQRNMHLEAMNYRPDQAGHSH